MRKRGDKVFWSIIITFVLILSFALSAKATLTDEQMMQKIREFVGDPSMQFDDIWGPYTGAGGEWKNFASGNHKNTFRVDTDTGEVVGATFAEWWDLLDQEERPTPTITLEQAQQIAYDYAKAKYSGFETMNKVLQTAESKEGWDFRWNEVVPETGALAPSGVSVTVHCGTGKVLIYAGGHTPLKISTVPKMSKQQVISRAQQYLQTQDQPEYVGLGVMGDDVGDQSLGWGVSFPYAGIGIDDQTGEVTSAMYPGGGGGGGGSGSRRPVRPKPQILVEPDKPLNIYNLLMVDGVAYVPPETFGLLGASIEKDKTAKKITIKKDNRRVIVDTETKIITLNEGKEIKDVRFNNNRPVVPLRIICKALQIPIDWEADKKVIHIKVKPEEGKPPKAKPGQKLFQ